MQSKVSPWPSSTAGRSPLPSGVILRRVDEYRDTRGTLSEIFRADWFDGVNLVQWNASHCRTNSLRGVHLHLDHSDYLVVTSGRFAFGLHDARRDSSTYGLTVMLELEARDTLLIAPGVAHGFYCLDEGLLIYGMTHRWDIADDLGCQWNDPGHGLIFPTTDPILSERDARAGSFKSLVEMFNETAA